MFSVTFLITGRFPRKMKKTAAIFVAAALFVAVFAIAALSQAVPVPPPSVPTVSPCPTVTIAAPPGPVFAPQAISFTLTIAGGDPNVQKFLTWSVSGGSIFGGQGTTTIRVDTTDVDGPVTATVLITGYPAECYVSANGTV